MWVSRISLCKLCPVAKFSKESQRMGMWLCYPWDGMRVCFVAQALRDSRDQCCLRSLQVPCCRLNLNLAAAVVQAWSALQSSSRMRAVGFLSSRLGNRFWWHFVKTVCVSLLDNLLCQGTLLPRLQHAPGNLFLWLSSPVCSQILTGLCRKISVVQTNLIYQAIKLRLLLHWYSGVLSPWGFLSVMI